MKPCKKPVSQSAGGVDYGSASQPLTRWSGPRRAAMVVSLAVALGCGIGAGTTLADVTSSQSSRSDSRDLHVVVKPGDSLNSILKRELESVDDWKLIARTNKIAEPNNLRPGDVIVIPHSLLHKRNFARLAFVKGTGELIRAVTRLVEVLKKGVKVFVGDTISTGNNGFVSLAFRDSTLVNIQPNSVVLIEKLECFEKKEACVISLRADDGELNLDVGRADFEKPTKFTIETPYASAAVRGTVFDFEIREGNVMGVTEGEVEISYSGESAVVPIGKGTLAGEGRSVSTVYDLLLATEFPEFVDFERVSAQDTLQWNSLSDASRYIATIASDEAMTNVVATRATSARDRHPTVIESTFQPGDYFLSVRGIDENGLKGFPAVKKLRQVSIDKDEGPDLDIEVVDELMSVRSISDSPLEVRVGNELQSVNGLERLLQYQTFVIEPDQLFELDVTSNETWYITAREILSDRSVSVYGGLYEYKADR